MNTPDIIKETVHAEDPARTVYLITNPDTWQCIALPDAVIRDTTYDAFPTWDELVIRGGLIAVDRDQYGEGVVA